MSVPLPMPKITEYDMTTWLGEHRYSQRAGNGRRYVYAAQVRSHAGFDAARTADAVAMDLWPSKGLVLHGHEIKISRSDWLHELRQPEKWLPVGRYCTRWWLVVPTADIVRPGELPDTWGLMVVGPTGAQVVKQAPRLTPEPLKRTFVAALLRAAVQTECGRMMREARTAA